MAQEERLFGVHSRAIGLISVSSLYHPGGASSCVVTMQPAARKQCTTLHVNLDAETSPGPVLGIIMPLLHLWYLSPTTWNVHAQKVAQRLGKDGYEVRLS